MAADFDPEVGLPKSDVEAAIRVGEAYEAVLDDYIPYNEAWDESKGEWGYARHNWLGSSSYFDAIDSDGNGRFSDRHSDSGTIPSSFITTPRAQWVADWQAKKQAKVDEYKQRQQRHQHETLVEKGRLAALRSASIEAKEKRLRAAIADPESITPRGTDETGVPRSEAMADWLLRAVNIVLERSK